MAARAQLLLRQFRNMGWKYFVPWVLLFGLIPLLTWRYIQSSGLTPDVYDYMRPGVYNDFERYIPMALVWYLVLLFYEFVDNPACELLYAYDGVKKTRLIDLLAVHLHIVLMAALLLFGYQFILPGLWQEFGRLCIILLVYSCTMYGLMYLAKSTLFAAMAVVIYHLLGAFMWSDGALFDLFSEMRIDGTQPPPTNYTPFLLWAAILLGLGVFLNRRYVK
ncbi:hypothetical protein [Neobittarella massiliensis]|uniref:hypothetical protein n=1 Tax=Neobittarella massiliensis (ex Bilen et al. 2018) TaxID=2041842 RepID=UPI000CF7447B|nr:hypothetical protein [Neobittarella massiliensis]